MNLLAHSTYRNIGAYNVTIANSKLMIEIIMPQQMMDHVEDKPRDVFWDINQRNIVKYLLETWQLSERFSEADVNHVIGALEVVLAAS